MNTSSWNWKEKLKGWVVCRICLGPIFPWPNAVTHWLHEDNSDRHEAEPSLHQLNAWDIQRMGVQHGRQGASILDNPYGTDGPLYDGADSMGEALAWHTGWEAVRCEKGEPIIVVKLDDLDYLEFERD